MMVIFAVLELNELFNCFSFLSFFLPPVLLELYALPCRVT